MDHRTYNNTRGIAALTLVLILGIVATLTAVGVIFVLVRQVAQERAAIEAEQALAVAEAGAEEVALRIRRGEVVPSPLTLAVGSGTATVTNSKLASIVTIISRGDVGSTRRAVELTLRESTTEVNFHYGVQIGDGGLTLGNGASVIGNVYSNGSISGDAGTLIDGDVFVARNTPVVQDQTWTLRVAGEDYVFGQSDPVEDVAQQFVPSITDVVDRIDLRLRRIGTPGNITLRIVTDDNGKPSKTSKQNVTIPQASVETGSPPTWISVDLGSTTRLSAGVPYWIVLDVAVNASDYYEWASDTGNGYANGIGMYSDRCCAGNPTWVDAGRDFNFRVYLGGAMHEIDNVDVGDADTVGDAQAPTIRNSDVTGNVDVSGTFENGTVGGNLHADTIQDCTVTGNADYNTEGAPACTVSGTRTTPTTPPTDPDALDFPISDQTIAGWKNDAAAGGTWAGDCIPGGAPADDCTTALSVGPLHITGNLLVTTNNITVTITGTVWVDGNIEIDNGARFRLDPSYGNFSGVVLSDGWIHIQNNGQFEGSGNPGSYIMLLTTLACTGAAEETGCGHHQSALDIHNNATGAIFYAPNGLIYIHQVINITEVVGWAVNIENNTTITYEQGLANAQFSSGPSGGYVTRSWREIVPP